MVDPRITELVPAYVLKLIRDANGIPVEHFMFYFNIGPSTSCEGWERFNKMRSILDSLVLAELIEVRYGSPTGEIADAEAIWKIWDNSLPRDKEPFLLVTPKLSIVQSALELSLSKLSDRLFKFGMKVHPSFGEPIKTLGKDVFVLMPFLEEMKPIYEDHIKKIADSLKLTCGRADDLFSPSEIMKDVWSSIVQSRFIIADCTGKNPNVFYEMGLPSISFPCFP